MFIDSNKIVISDKTSLWVTYQSKPEGFTIVRMRAATDIKTDNGYTTRGTYEINNLNDRNMSKVHESIANSIASNNKRFNNDYVDLPALYKIMDKAKEIAVC